jgi:hypothetical protein
VDDLARWVATPVSRRGALKFGAGAFAALAIVPLRPRIAFAQGGFTKVCSPETEDCFAWRCPAGTTCCPRPHDPNIHTICPSGGCCDPCSPSQSRCQPDGYCGPGPVAKDCCKKPCGNDCCRDDQQCLRGQAFDGGDICMRCPEVITDLKQCPNRVQRAEPNVNGCGGEGVPAWITHILDGFKEADFRPACNAHDVCYGRCGETQERCDKELRDDLQAICRATYGTDDFEHRGVCVNQAGKYYKAVSSIGSTFYEKAQRDFCQCCPDSPRDKGDFPSPPSNPRPTAPDTLSPKDQDLDVPVNCSGPTPCEGTLALSSVAGSGGGARGAGRPAAAARRRRKLLLGEKTFSIPARHTARVRVPLSRKGRRLLRKRKRVTVLATTRVRLANGTRVDTGVDSFVLKARRASQRR